MKNLSLGEMKKLLNAVSYDVRKAKLYLDSVNRLDELFERQNIVLAFSSAFWTNTHESYYLAMQMCLMRVYDQRPDAVGLPLLLRRIKENIDLFSNKSFEDQYPHLNYTIQNRISDEAFNEQLNIDINRVNNKNNIIKNLIIIRHNNGAHRSEKVLFGKKNLGHIKISHTDLERLINESMEILNFYQIRFDNISHTGYMHGFGDLQKIFEIIEKYLQQKVIKEPQLDDIQNYE